MQAEDIQHIKSVLKEWNKFPANAEADFDCLCNEVLAALEDDFGSFELAAVIQNEFINHFGKEGSSDDVAQIAASISGWWLNREGVR